MKNLFIAITITTLVSVVNAASFDCRKASTLIENAICSDNELSKLDDSLGQTYKKALSKTTDKKALKSEQRAWLSKVRNQCQTSVCLKDVYRKRIAAIGVIDYSGEYEKENAIAEIKQDGDFISFFVNSIVGQNVCNLEGMGGIIEANNRELYGYVSEDTEKCLVTFDFSDGSVEIKTKGCSGYCGMNAGGSMDGMYKKVTAKNITGRAKTDIELFKSMIFPTYTKMTIEQFSELFAEKEFGYDDNKGRTIFYGKSQNVIYKKKKKDILMDVSVKITEKYDSEGLPQDFDIVIDLIGKKDNEARTSNIHYRSTRSFSKFWLIKDKSTGKVSKKEYESERAEEQLHKLIEKLLMMLKYSNA